MYTNKGDFNIAAELLADTNTIPFSGIDIGRFGENINTILYRTTIEKTSLLDQFDKALALFEQYYTYIKSFAKPTFRIDSNFITIHLPVIETTNDNLTPDEQEIFTHIHSTIEIDRTTLEEKTGFNKDKTLRLINSLIEKNRITKIGSGSSIRYRLL